MRDLDSAGSFCPAYEVLCHAQSRLYTRDFPILTGASIRSSRYHRDHVPLSRRPRGRLRGTEAARLHARRRRAGRFRQDGAGRASVPRVLARPQFGRHHQRHLHARGRRVSGPPRGAAAGAHRRRRDGRLSRTAPSARTPASTSPPSPSWKRRSRTCKKSSSNRAATTWRRPSRRNWPTAPSTSSTWPRGTRSRARGGRASAAATCSSSTRSTSPRTSGPTST